MRIFITGVKGQLGADLARRAGATHAVAGGEPPEFDVTQFDQVLDTFEAFRPQVVIHCAAMTDVDGAARQPDLAYRINGFGTQNVALACARCQVPLLYVSSNEVFDGLNTEPYREFDRP